MSPEGTSLHANSGVASRYLTKPKSRESGTEHPSTSRRHENHSIPKNPNKELTNRIEAVMLAIVGGVNVWRPTNFQSRMI